MGLKACYMYLWQACGVAVSKLNKEAYTLSLIKSAVCMCHENTFASDYVANMTSMYTNVSETKRNHDNILV